MVDAFPADETPTPTRILRMADMDLFGELKVLVARRLLLFHSAPAKWSPVVPSTQLSEMNSSPPSRTPGSTVAGRTHSTCTSGRLRRP